MFYSLRSKFFLVMKKRTVHDMNDSSRNLEYFEIGNYFSINCRNLLWRNREKDRNWNKTLKRKVLKYLLRVSCKKFKYFDWNISYLMHNYKNNKPTWKTTLEENEKVFVVTMSKSDSWHWKDLNWQDKYRKISAIKRAERAQGLQ